MNDLTRRTLLSASCAIIAPGLVASPVLAGIVAAEGVASAETSVLALYREHEAMRRHMDDTSTSSEEFDRLYPIFTDLEWRLTREPALNMADLAAKVLVLTPIRDDFNSIFEPDLLAEMEAILMEALA